MRVVWLIIPNSLVIALLTECLQTDNCSCVRFLAGVHRPCLLHLYALILISCMQHPTLDYITLLRHILQPTLNSPPKTAHPKQPTLNSPPKTAHPKQPTCTLPFSLFSTGNRGIFQYLPIPNSTGTRFGVHTYTPICVSGVFVYYVVCSAWGRLWCIMPVQTRTRV